MFGLYNYMRNIENEKMFAELPSIVIHNNVFDTDRKAIPLVE